jgi:hypothetical protein
MANITTTQLDDSIATIVAAQALGYLQANTVMAQLVARDWDDEVATHGQTIKIPFLGSLTASDKAQGATVTLQQPADSAVSVTLNKHKEVSFLLEDYARVLARPHILQNYMADGIKVLAEQIDADLTALYAGLSQSIDATAGLAEDDFREGRRLLNAAKAPLGDRFAVLNEDAEYQLLGMERFVNRDYAELQGAPQRLFSAYSGKFMGFSIFMDQKITSTGGENKNLLFHRNAFILVTRPLPPAPEGAGVIQKVMSENGLGLRVTLSYNPDYLGVQVTVDVLYGVAELRDSHGVVVRTTDM